LADENEHFLSGRRKLLF